MKKIIAILCAAALLLPMSALAAENEDREYTIEGGYFYTVEEGQVIESGEHAGERTAVRVYHAPNNTTYYCSHTTNGTIALSARGFRETELEFPSTVNGVKVTTVSLSKSLIFLEKVVIPEGVEHIYGFGGCEKLKEISIPDTVRSISISTFQYDESLETVALPEGLTVLEDGLFKDCKSLKKIKIPSTVTEIQRDAFAGCSSLEYIDIPASVEKIEPGAFIRCTSLKKVDFHEGLISIGNCGFTDCPIEDLKLPSTLAKIGGEVFLRNKALKTVVIPQNVRSIGFSAFSQTSLENVVFEGEPEEIGIQAFFETPIKEVKGLSRNSIIKFWKAFKKTPWHEIMKNDAEPFLVDEDGTLIGYIGTSTDAVIPDTVKTISENAFESSITSVKIPNTVTHIERAAFYGCDKLTEITIPASVTKIGEMAFSHCYRLKNITFEYSDKSLQLDNCAFQFTLASPETLVTNNRRYSNQKTAFQNTYFDPDYVPMIENGKYVDESYTAPPTATPRPESTATPDAAAVPTMTPAPAVTAEPQDINVRGGETITIALGDKEITFTDARPYIDENGRTQIPIRAIAEALGCKVDWDDATRTATITRGDRTVYITIGNDTMQVNNEMITMDTTAEIRNDRTYIPLRFVGEALGMTVNWKG